MEDLVLSQLKSQELLSCIERPGYQVYEHDIETPDGVFRSGVYYHDSRVTRSGNEVNIDTWICTPLYVEALTSDRGQNYGALLRFVNPEGVWQELAIPLRLFSGNAEEVRAELLDRGVEICPNSHKRLTAYIISQRPSKRLTSTHRTGWHNDYVFVLPRRKLGQGEDVIFQAPGASRSDYSSGGDVEEWSNTIGLACQGNPTVIFAISSALAGTLLNPLGKQGGGFHLIGDSSCGKTTLLLLAASVWGKAEDFIGSWRATGNGLEGAAVARNDTCMILDEISEANSREIGSIVYAIANGQGKTRANRQGFAREASKWRLLLLSSGERGLSTHMAESGTKVKAGQEVRLPDVPVSRTHGIFDELHGCSSGAELSDRLKQSANQYFGHAGPDFVYKLIEASDRVQLRRAYQEILAEFKAADGQEQRTADRYAITALAGEMAIEFGLLPLEKGAALSAAQKMFYAWKDNRGSGNSEHRQILQSISDYLSRHGDSRFSALRDDSTISVKDRAGWWRDSCDERIYMFTKEGLRDATVSFDFKRVIKALEEAQWIPDCDYGRPSKNVRVNKVQQRLYHIKPCMEE
jgi:putative DNA primase/helicase